MHARKINDRLTLSIAFFLGLSVFTNGIYRYNLPAYQFHNSAKQLDNQGPILSFFNGPVQEAWRSGPRTTDGKE